MHVAFAACDERRIALARGVGPAQHGEAVFPGVAGHEVVVGVAWERPRVRELERLVAPRRAEKHVDHAHGGGLQDGSDKNRSSTELP